MPDNNKQKDPFASGVEGFMKSFGTGLGEHFLHMLQGPEYLEEKHEEKRAQISENMKQEEDLFGELSKQADLGKPFTPEQSQSALKAGINPALLDTLNQRSQSVMQQRQKGLQQLQEAYQKGSFGDPNDPELKKLIGIQAFGIAHSDDPNMVAMVNNFTALEEKRLAAQQAANIKYNEALNVAQNITLPLKKAEIGMQKQKDLDVEKVKNRDALGRIGAAASAHLGSEEALVDYKNKHPSPATMNAANNASNKAMGARNAALEAAGGVTDMRHEIGNLGMNFALPGGGNIKGNDLNEVMQSAVDNGVLDEGHAKRFTDQFQRLANDPNQTDDSVGLWLTQMTKDFPEPFRSLFLGNIIQASQGAQAGATKTQKNVQGYKKAGGGSDTSEDDE